MTEDSLPIIFFAAAFLATAIGVGVFCRIAARAGLLDHPNERSSHSDPRPRGGGVVIVAVCLGLYVAWGVTTGSNLSWSFVVGGLTVAGISWLDDRHTLPPFIRLVAQCTAAAAVIVGLGHFTEITLPVVGWSIDLGWFAVPITFLWIVWMINAYNFMDGIDGIAGSQGVVAGFAWAALGVMSGNRPMFVFGAVVAFSCLGFLAHNWSPARVFMGDVGSAFLGYTFAVIPLLAMSDGQASRGGLFLAGVSFLWLFAFDTLFTFAVRLLKGEKVWLAHRQHLYQQMVIEGAGHALVTLIYAGLAAAVSAAFIAARVYGMTAEAAFVLVLIFSAGAVLVLGLRKKR